MQSSLDKLFSITTQKRNNQVNDENRQRAALNGTQGDHTKLDQLVNQAKNIAGLTVKQDDTWQEHKNADDANGISAWLNWNKNDYANQVAVLEAKIKEQQQKNATYDQAYSQFQQQVKALESDQHAIGSSFFKNGDDNKNGYMKIDYNYDVTYHYNLDTDQIIVTNIKIQLNREEPTQKGGGFWDTVVFTSPNASLPQELGNFYLPNGDFPGTNGDSLWNKYGKDNKDVFAFVSQNNKTEQYAIKYNTNGITPYAVNRNSDGSFTLFKTIDRGNEPNHSGNDDQGWHIWWANGDLKKNIVVPQKPTRATSETSYHLDQLNVNPVAKKTSEVHYHYDVFENY